MVLRSARLPLSAALLVALLAVLAVVQYRWVGQLGEAERARLRTSAQARADAFALAFDREVTRAFLVLQMDAATRRARDAAAYRNAWQTWRRSAAWPDLVKRVYLAERRADGGVEVRRFDPDAPAFVETPWPADLAAARKVIEDTPASGLDVLVTAGTSPVMADVPALLLPVTELEGEPTPGSLLQAARGGPLRLENRTLRVFRRGQASGPGPEPLAGAFVIVALDREVLFRRVLPELSRRHLAGAEGLEYDAVVRPRNGGAPVFRTDGASDTGPARPDATAPLLDIRFDEIDSSILGAVPEMPGPGGAHVRPFRVAVRLASPPGAPQHGRWQLALVHRAGSVDRAVDGARVRNLAVSFGVLVVLGAGIVLLVASSQRARRLAERQVAFVAGVTHELRTPLAVIQSAAENLADGVVADAPQVRRYGTLIRDEGRRLAGMVEDALLYAGADARRRDTESGLVAVGDLVDRGVAAAFGGGPPDVEKDIAPDLPAVRGDAAALARAVQNLVANARKHAGPWVAVRARRVPEAAAVAITVEDKGPGLDADELRRLGEPFFRGRRARETQVAGSGLGLAVVRQIAAAHGGRLDVRSGPGEGSAFTLVLPAP
jgi:signal transduction histidine kinase